GKQSLARKNLPPTTSASSRYFDRGLKRLVRQANLLDSLSVSFWQARRAMVGLFLPQAQLLVRVRPGVWPGRVKLATVFVNSHETYTDRQIILDATRSACRIE